MIKFKGLLLIIFCSTSLFGQDVNFSSEYNKVIWPVALGLSGGITGDDGNYKRLALYHGGSISLQTGSNSPGIANSRLFIDNTGKVGIGTTGPSGNLQVVGSSGWDTSTKLYLTNGATDYGRTNLILTGRLQSGNDAWNFGSMGRNSIVFASNSSASGANVGGLGTEQFSLQHELASNSLGFLSQTQGANPILVLKQSGYMGIGTSIPQSRLHVANGSIIASDPNYNEINVRLDGTSIPTIKFTRYTGTVNSYHNAFVGQFWNQTLGQYSLGIGTGSSTSGDQNATTNALAITLNGNIGIGTTDPGSFKLAVNGKTWSTEVQVAVTRPPDYVFEPTYNLSPLDSIKTYIDKNKHLPDVPSAKEMEKNGLNLGEMNMLLLKKIEELTLYVIELKTGNEEMKRENLEAKEQMKKMQVEINQLKK